MKVSVCMATYNGAKHIKEQVDSILSQEFPNHSPVELELIVSDDESTDETVDILKSYHDDRIQIYTHTQETCHRYYRSLYAATANFGHALSYATGDYIFLSDQDDIWHPRKIDVALDVLEKKGGVCAADFYVITDDRRKIGRMHYRMERFGKKNLYGFSCGFAKEELKYILPMPDVPQHDLFIQLLAMRRNKLVYIDKVCAYHRWIGKNTSYTGNSVPWIIKLFTRIKLITIVLWRCVSVGVGR